MIKDYAVYIVLEREKSYDRGKILHSNLTDEQYGVVVEDSKIFMFKEKDGES